MSMTELFSKLGKRIPLSLWLELSTEGIAPTSDWEINP